MLTAMALSGKGVCSLRPFVVAVVVLDTRLCGPIAAVTSESFAKEEKLLFSGRESRAPNAFGHDKKFGNDPVSQAFRGE